MTPRTNSACWQNLVDSVLRNPIEDLVQAMLAWALTDAMSRIKELEEQLNTKEIEANAGVL